MKFNLRDTVLLSGFIGALVIWILEIRRVGFSGSYDLLLLALLFLFAFQYFRVRTRQAGKEMSPTVKQMIEKRKQDAQTKTKK